VRENLDDHGGIFNGGDERQGPAALRTGGHVDLEQLNRLWPRAGRVM